MQRRALERLIEANRPEDWGLTLVIAAATLGALAVVKYVVARRVQFGFGVAYRTGIADLEAIPAPVRESIEAQPKARFDRAHLAACGDSALGYEAVDFVLDADYNVYMDIHQAVLLGLLRRLRDRGNESAFPTRTLHVERDVSATDSRLFRHSGGSA